MLHSLPEVSFSSPVNCRVSGSLSILIADPEPRHSRTCLGFSAVLSGRLHSCSPDTLIGFEADRVHVVPGALSTWNSVHALPLLAEVSVTLPVLVIVADSPGPLPVPFSPSITIGFTSQ